ncbi:MAG TPA: hypothetical protein VMA32_13370 [Streptosporangiaceae bacterium]|nr:hypothetical protein [Streptosporangiaceae bacterium]
MQVGHEYRLDLTRVEPELLEGAELGSTAVQQEWGEAMAGPKADACLVPAAAAEGISATSESHRQLAIA